MSRAKGEFDRAKQLEEDYNYMQGRKVEELRNRKEMLEGKREEVENGLRAMREKREAGGGVGGSRTKVSSLQNSAMYTFKQEPFDKAEEIRKLANPNTEDRLKMVNSYLDPKEQLIQNRKAELDRLKKEYLQNGGDDPNFFKTLEGLQNKYELAQSKART